MQFNINSSNNNNTNSTERMFIYIPVCDTWFDPDCYGKSEMHKGREGESVRKRRGEMRMQEGGEEERKR